MVKSLSSASEYLQGCGGYIGSDETRVRENWGLLSARR